MNDKKTYTMRPARKKPDGGYQAVPIGFFQGHARMVADDITRTVTPQIHNAYMAGDIDIDSYPHERGKVNPTVKTQPKPKGKSGGKPKPKSGGADPGGSSEDKPKPEGKAVDKGK